MLRDAGNGWTLVDAPRRLQWGAVHDARALGAWRAVQAQLAVDVPRLRVRVGRALRATRDVSVLKQQVRAACRGDTTLAQHLLALVTQGALEPVYERLTQEFPPPWLVLSGEPPGAAHSVRVRGGGAPSVTHTRTFDLARLHASDLTREARLRVRACFEPATATLSLVRVRCHAA